MVNEALVFEPSKLNVDRRDGIMSSDIPGNHIRSSNDVTASRHGRKSSAKEKLQLRNQGLNQQPYTRNSESQGYNAEYWQWLFDVQGRNQLVKSAERYNSENYPRSSNGHSSINSQHPKPVNGFSAEFQSPSGNQQGQNAGNKPQLKYFAGNQPGSTDMHKPVQKEHAKAGRNTPQPNTTKTKSPPKTKNGYQNGGQDTERQTPEFADQPSKPGKNGNRYNAYQDFANSFNHELGLNGEFNSYTFNNDLLNKEPQRGVSENGQSRANAKGNYQSHKKQSGIPTITVDQRRKANKVAVHTVHQPVDVAAAPQSHTPSVPGNSFNMQPLIRYLLLSGQLDLESMFELLLFA